MFKKLSDCFQKGIPIVDILGIGLLLAVIGWAGTIFLGDIWGRPNRYITLATSDSVQNYASQASTVGELLAEAGHEISSEDKIVPSPESPVTPGLVVSYRKAVPVILIDGEKPRRTVMSASGTVCELLDEAGVLIGPLDRVTPPLEAKIESNLVVNITRVEVIDVTRTREIPPPVEYKADPSLRRGEVVEIKPGKPGKIQDVTRIYYKNGKETTRVNLKSQIIEQPVSKVARVGTHPVPAPVSRGIAPGKRVLQMIATAYDPGPGSCGASADGRTATGHIAQKGVCAVDPRVIPLGTKLWIDGYGYALACDTGGAIKGNRIDVCFNTRWEALRWGRRVVTVYIIE